MIRQYFDHRSALAVPHRWLEADRITQSLVEEMIAGFVGDLGATGRINCRAAPSFSVGAARPLFLSP